MAQAQRIMRHPRVVVTDIEARLGTRFTAQTIAALRDTYPGVRFVWLMGADNLAQFHLWENWRRIASTVPIGVLARSGDRIAARTSPAATIYRRFMVPGPLANGLGRRRAPAWAFVNLPLHPASSSAIRAGGGWA